MRLFSRVTSGLLAAAAAALISSALAEGPGRNPLAPDPRLHVITDARTGLAIFGFDPVAYHVEHAARPGLAVHEITLDNRIWRFRSAANRAAFAADPAAYIPAYGGHDAVRVAEGFMVKGDPELFLIAGGELLFFRDPASRDRFASDPALRRKAREVWPAAVRQHAGH